MCELWIQVIWLGGEECYGTVGCVGVWIFIGFEYRYDFCSLPFGGDYVTVNYVIEELCDDGEGMVGEMFDIDGCNVIWA